MTEITRKDEEKFISNYDSKDYPSFALTTDIVLLTIKAGQLSVLLVERGGHPFKGCWALPGGFVGANESADEAVFRELEEETGINLDKVHVEQIRTYTEPQRDPRMRVISTGYLALLPDLPDPVAGDDAAQARFFPVEDILAPKDSSDAIELAFDHEEILKDGLERARGKLEYTPLATTFLEDPFTLADLRRVYETVWGEKIHAGNFRRKILSTQNLVESCGEKGESSFEGGKRAQLYKKGSATMLQPAMLRNSI